MMSAELTVHDDYALSRAAWLIEQRTKYIKKWRDALSQENLPAEYKMCKREVIEENLRAEKQLLDDLIRFCEEYLVKNEFARIRSEYL